MKTDDQVIYGGVDSQVKVHVAAVIDQRVAELLFQAFTEREERALIAVASDY